MMAMWARTGQPGFFVAAVTFTRSLFYARLTALLVKSDLVKSEQNADRELLVVAGYAQDDPRR